MLTQFHVAIWRHQVTMSNKCPIRQRVVTLWPPSPRSPTACAISLGFGLTIVGARASTPATWSTTCIKKRTTYNMCMRFLCKMLWPGALFLLTWVNFYSVRFWIGMLSTARRLENATRVKKKKGGGGGVETIDFAQFWWKIGIERIIAIAMAARGYL